MRDYNHNIVLLDTMAASGWLYSLLKENEEKGKKWAESIRTLTESIKQPEYIIPTPVFYEIACRSIEWYKLIEKLRNTDYSLAKYINYNIDRKVLHKASEYHVTCLEKPDKNTDPSINKSKSEISFVDALIAGYSLVYGHWIITENHDDFKEKYFHAECMSFSPNSTVLKRRFLYLLFPK